MPHDRAFEHFIGERLFDPGVQEPRVVGKSRRVDGLLNLLSRLGVGCFLLDLGECVGFQVGHLVLGRGLGHVVA